MNRAAHPKKKSCQFFRLNKAFIVLQTALAMNLISPAMASEEMKMSGQRTVINRAVLTVGGDVFTAADAVAMLMIWNLTRVGQESPVALTSDWLSALPLGDTTGIDPLLMMKSWPEDVTVFFRLALIWADVQKLNLFVQREQDVSAVVKRFSEQFDSLAKDVPQPLIKQIRRAGDSIKFKWVESVLRVRSFQRVRGSLERNKNLFSAGWHWHQPSSGQTIKK